MNNLLLILHNLGSGVKKRNRERGLRGIDRKTMDYIP